MVYPNKPAILCATFYPNRLPSLIITLLYYTFSLVEYGNFAGTT